MNMVWPAMPSSDRMNTLLRMERKRRIVPWPVPIPGGKGRYVVTPDNKGAPCPFLFPVDLLSNIDMNLTVD